ncbi:MAG: PVC-type heme-binding CxxCH protein, partial [Limisphaerales bacterium]
MRREFALALRLTLFAGMLTGWSIVSTSADGAPTDMPAPLAPNAALRSLRVAPDDLEIELVASEPLIRDPVAIDFGSDGQLYVLEMHDYPAGLDGQGKPGGRLNVLSDTNGDGFPDKSEVWADDLPFPTGLMAWEEGALVCAAPDILWLRDRDGDGRAESREVLFTGFATHNFQARVNSPRWGLDGWVYGAAGLFGGSIESPRTGKTHPLSGHDFRFDPATGAFEPASGLTQQGRVRDEFGNWFGCDNGSWMWHFPFPERALSRNPALRVQETRIYVPKGPDPNAVFPRSVTLERFNDPHQANRATSACGLEVYRDSVLGPGFRHNAFIAEPVHNLVRRFQVVSTGTSFAGTRSPTEVPFEFLASTDSWFRPVELRTGPDGGLWVVDMYRFVIEHPRWITPERLATLDVRAGSDRGRIYRVRPRDKPLRPATGNLARLAPREWVRVLASPNGVQRDLAHRLILKSGDATLDADIRSLARNAPDPEVRVQALAVLQGRHQL